MDSHRISNNLVKSVTIGVVQSSTKGKPKVASDVDPGSSSSNIALVTLVSSEREANISRTPPTQKHATQQTRGERDTGPVRPESLHVICNVSFIQPHLSMSCDRLLVFWLGGVITRILPRPVDQYPRIVPFRTGVGKIAEKYAQKSGTMTTTHT